MLLTYTIMFEQGEKWWTAPQSRLSDWGWQRS